MSIAAPPAAGHQDGCLQLGSPCATDTWVTSSDIGHAWRPLTTKRTGIPLQQDPRNNLRARWAWALASPRATHFPGSSTQAASGARTIGHAVTAITKSNAGPAGPTKPTQRSYPTMIIAL